MKSKPCVLIDIDHTLFPYFYTIAAMQNEVKQGVLSESAFAQITAVIESYKKGDLSYVNMGYTTLQIYASALKYKRYADVYQVDHAFAMQKIGDIRPIFRDFLAQKTIDIDVILVTSEPATMAQALARAIGAEYAIASQMTLTDFADLNYTGDINCLMTPAEKVAAIQDEWFQPTSILAAFGDSISDAGMLAMAKHPFAVTPSPELKKIAEEHNWNILGEQSTLNLANIVTYDTLTRD